jgi:hypothetical protein
MIAGLIVAAGSAGGVLFLVTVGPQIFRLR